MKFETEIIGLPSGESLTTYNPYVIKLFNLCLIDFNSKLNCWCFDDKDRQEIIYIINNPDSLYEI